jgi:3'(2'), 5'-bisphosphate nucleotidase
MTANDGRLAAELADEAGHLLLGIRRQLADGADPTAVRNEGDRRSHELLAARLLTARPDDGLLSEEGLDDKTRLEHGRVWIVDPLDGTREFGEDGRSDWAVHVALAIDGRAVIGAVALPALGQVLSTDGPPTLAPARPGPPVVVVSRSRAPREAEAVIDALGAVRLEMGSAGAKAMAVVRGEADAYVHAGGQYEWDSAAPVAVAAAAGLHTSRIDGSPLRYNRADPRLPDLVICRPELADSILASLRSA